MTMGGPLPHVIAAKAVAFREAARPEFREYAHKIVENSRALAAACAANGLEVLTGGTDNHLFLVNVRAIGLSGRQAETVLHECRITLNRNSLPFDPNGPWYTSGLRVGTAAVTTLGMGAAEMAELGSIIALVLKHTTPAPAAKDPAKKSKVKYLLDEKTKTQVLDRVAALLGRFPVYPELNLDLLKSAFTGQA
jgi:glycine hydroxymethyltransferase